MTSANTLTATVADDATVKSEPVNEGEEGTSA